MSSFQPWCQSRDGICYSYLWTVIWTNKPRHIGHIEKRIGDRQNKRNKGFKNN